MNVILGTFICLVAVVLWVIWCLPDIFNKGGKK